jgi:predicted O-methyltransferase YrrM
VTDPRWAAVDAYLGGLLLPRDEALEAALESSAAAGLPAIAVSPAQGKLLHLLARIHGARRVLEIGTLGGYSTIWLARALPPGGRVVTLELSPAYAELARANVARAGLADVVDIRVGPALETLPRLAEERATEGAGAAPFDLVFIDADKPSTAEYFDWAIRLARRGGVIVVDNVVRDGAVADPASEDAAVQGMRRFAERAAADPRVTATAVQTVGSKGYDGFVLALVVADP